MYSNQTVIQETLKPLKSTNAHYTVYDASSKPNDDISTSDNTIYWQNIQTLSKSNIAKDFRLNMEFELTDTDTAANKYFFFKKNINYALNILINLNGKVVKETQGHAIMGILSSYSSQFKSFDDYDKQDIYVYDCADAGTGTSGTVGKFTKRTGKQGINAAGTFTAASNKCIIKTSTPLAHEFLLGPISGLNSMNVKITMLKGLKNIISTDITDYGLKLTKASITFTEYEGQSSSFSKVIPYFVPYLQQVSSTEVQAQTRNVSGAPAAVFNFVQLNPEVNNSIDNTHFKTALIKCCTVDVGNSSNVYNASSPEEMYSRCNADASPYLGSIQDFLDESTHNGFERSLIKVNMRNLNQNISTPDLFRYNIRCTVDSGLTNYYLYSVYCYRGLLIMNDNESTLKYIFDEPLIDCVDYDEDEDMFYGGSIFSKMRDFIKNKGISSLLDKGKKIVDTLAPNSGISQGLSKAQEVSNVLGLSSSIF